MSVDRTPGSRWRDPFWLVLLLLPAALLLPGLGDDYLWQDEAETALLARSVLIHGLPVADAGGRPIRDQPDGRDVNANGVWIWSPWLQHYVAAASFAVLGESTTSARLPFVLAAWLALLLAYPVFTRLTGDRSLARQATLLLLLSVPYLLLARQCRYYPLLTLLTVLFLGGYVSRTPIRSVAAMGLAAAGIAWSFPPQLVLLGGACGLHALLRGERDRLLRVVLATGLGVATAAPFLVTARIWDRDYRGGGAGFDSWLRYASTLRAYAIQLHVFTWPYLLAIPVLWHRAGSFAGAQPAAVRAGLAVAVGLWLLALVAPPSALALGGFLALSAVLSAAGIAAALETVRRSGGSDWPALVGLVLVMGVALTSGIVVFPFFRYWAGVLPLLALATAATLRFLAGGRPGLAAGLVAVVVVCDLLQVGPLLGASAVARSLGVGRERPPTAAAPGHYPAEVLAHDLLHPRESRTGIRSLLYEHLGELARDEVGPLEAVVTHLHSHAEPGDRVLTTYEHFPLLFYTDLDVTSVDHADPDGPPADWILIHGSPSHAVPPWVGATLRRGYVRVPLDARERPWENTPEPYWHQFRPRPGARTVRLFGRVAE